MTVKVVVLMGGTSAERDVSLATGRGIMGALREAGYEVLAIDTAGSRELEDRGKSFLPEVGREPPRAKSLPVVGAAMAMEVMGSSSLAGADVVFIALHGGRGEDGTIQALMEAVGIPYTGSGVLASALAMHKPTAKRIFQQLGVRTPRWFTSEKEASFDVSALAERIARQIGFPVVVKPTNQGSTVGLSVVAAPNDLPRSIQVAEEYAEEILFEEYIAGRELTVAILGQEALPVVEIHPEHGLYDYECKYTKGKSRYTVPARLSAELAEEIQRVALLAFQGLRCEGYARVDFRLDDREKLYCLEVNTLPGMTETSLVPMAAKAAGIGFPQLVDRIVRLALKRRSQGCGR